MIPQFIRPYLCLHPSGARGWRMALAVVLTALQVLPGPLPPLAMAQEAAPPPRDNVPAPPAAAPEAAPAAPNGETAPEAKPAPTPLPPPSTSEAICLLVEFGGPGPRASLRVLRPPDLAGEPLPAQCGRSDDPKRPARPGHRPVHAGNGQRTRPVRSLRSGVGPAESGGIPRRAAPHLRQSRPRRRGLQCRPAPGARLARRTWRPSGRNPQLRS